MPKRLLVVGAGVIGLELGSVWRRLGSEVLVVEFLDRILPGTDAEIARTVQRILAKQGMSFKLSSKVTGIAKTAAGHKIAIEPASAGGPDGMVVEADVVLVAIGRVPYTEGLGLEAAGVALDERKRIAVDQHFQTSVPGIYAIGDAIAGPMLAHKAEDEGVAAAEIIAGQAGHVNYDAIPNVIYIFPEVATVGKSEEELKAAGIAYTVGKFPLTANGRAKVNKTTEGLVKILADAATDRILGVHIIAAAGERDDRGGRGDHGVRRLGRGPRPHLPRPPDADRGRQGSRHGRGQAQHPHVSLLAKNGEKELRLARLCEQVDALLLEENARAGAGELGACEQPVHRRLVAMRQVPVEHLLHEAAAWGCAGGSCRGWRGRRGAACRRSNRSARSPARRSGSR